MRKGGAVSSEENRSSFLEKIWVIRGLAAVLILALGLIFTLVVNLAATKDDAIRKNTTSIEKLEDRMDTLTAHYLLLQSDVHYIKEGVGDIKTALRIKPSHQSADTEGK